MKLRKNLVAAGAAVGMTLAGLGVAAAQTDGSTTTTPPADSADSADARPGPGGPGGRHGGPGKGMGIHGEFVTAAPSGGYQTIATQKGDVTDVSATSIKVKSEDGYERTYVVNDDTMVGAGNNGIADVAVGDDVHVTAVVTGDTATAKSVHERPAAPSTPAN
jgi:hypothetical protein